MMTYYTTIASQLWYNIYVMDNCAGKKQIIKNERIAVALLLLAGFALRLLLIGSLPYGLNQDEASAGYDAWALLN